MGAGASSYSTNKSRGHYSHPRVNPKPIVWRTRELEVICLGLPRTGTASLREALRYLNYGDVYHFSTVYNDRPTAQDATLWSASLKDKYETKIPIPARRWDRLLGQFGALTDIPSIIFAEELLAAYPYAKVILTVRDTPEQWHDSYNATIKPWFHRIWSESTPQGFKQKWKDWWHTDTPIEAMSKLIQKHYLTPLEAGGTQFYKDHNKKVTEMVPYDRLLIYNVNEGWEPVCNFLRKKAPPVKFPHVNERESFPSMFADPPPPSYSAVA